MDTQTLAWWKNAAELAAWVLAGSAAVAAGFVWFTGRELDRRRAAEHAELQSAAIQARQDAEALRNRFAPRTLGPEQREAMSRLLRRGGGHVLIVYVADQEARAFARLLKAVLEDAGWTVSTEGGMGFGPIIGLSFELRNPDAPPARTAILQEALEVLGVEVPMKRINGAAEDEVRLIVGSKPDE